MKSTFITALLKVLGAILIAGLYRATIVLGFWVFAPSACFVLAAWIFLSDCDFGLLLRSFLPGEGLQAKYYFRNRVVWIVGASSGIGRALAVRVCRDGGYVILSGRNEQALKAVSAECSRAHLVEGIRMCNRSESKIASVIDEAPRNPRAFVLPCDLVDESSLMQCVNGAHSWRGRVDAVYCFTGSLQCAESPPVDSEIGLFETDVFPAMRLLKTLVPSFTDSAAKLHEPAANSSDDERAEEEVAKIFPIRLPSVEAFAKLREMHSSNASVTNMIRLASVAGFTKSTEVISASRVTRLLRRYALGDVDWKRRCNVVYPICADARLARPGSVALGAAHVALAAYAEGYTREVRAQALQGAHSTDLRISVVLLGTAASNARQNCVLSDGQRCGEEDAERYPTGADPDAVAATRVAELLVRVARDGLREAWVARGYTLLGLYFQYYLPWVYSYLARRKCDLNSLKSTQNINGIFRP